jgi:hypothetical protein
VDIHARGDWWEMNIWPKVTICETGALVAIRYAVYYQGVDIN